MQKSDLSKDEVDSCATCFKSTILVAPGTGAMQRHCNARPPSVHGGFVAGPKGEAIFQSFSFFPQVTPDHWCFEFLSRKEVEAERAAQDAVKP